MSVTTYLGTSSQNSVLVTSCVSSGGSSAFYICLCIVLDLGSKLIWCTSMQGINAHWPGGPSAFGSHWWHWTAKSSLCALAVSNGGVYHKFYLGKTEMAIYMFIYALVFPYIFLLVDCFEWALIDDIEQQRVHSVLWQFRMGGLS